MVRKIFILSFLVAIAITSILSLHARIGGLYDWYSWYRQGAMPIEAVGGVKGIYVLHGRDAGNQYLHLTSNNEITVFDTVLSSDMIPIVLQAEEKVLLKYYPTATGKKYVFFLSGVDSSKIFYEGKMNDALWPSFIVVLMIFFLVMMIFLAVNLFFNFLNKDV